MPVHVSEWLVSLALLSPVAALPICLFASARAHCCESLLINPRIIRIRVAPVFANSHTPPHRAVLAAKKMLGI